MSGFDFTTILELKEDTHGQTHKRGIDVKIENHM